MKKKTAFKLFIMAISFILCAGINNACPLFAEGDDDFAYLDNDLEIFSDQIDDSINSIDYAAQIQNTFYDSTVFYAPNDVGAFYSQAIPAVANDLTYYREFPIEPVAASSEDPLSIDHLQRSTSEWGKIISDIPPPNTFDNQAYQYNQYFSPTNESTKQMDRDWQQQTTINGSMGTLKF